MRLLMVAVVVVAVAVVVLCLTTILRPSYAPAEIMTPGSQGVAGQGNGRVDQSASVEVAREAVEDPGVIFRVRDEAGTPLGSAFAFVAPGAGARCSSSAGARAVSQNGEIEIDRSEVDGKSVLFSANGMQAVLVKVGPADSYDVVMTRGVSLKLFARDSFGQPIPDVSIVVSGRPLPRYFEVELAVRDRSMVPCSLGEAAIQSGRTDSNGAASIGGLCEGPVYFSIFKDGYIQRSVTPYPRAVPCGDLAVVMDRAFVAVWKIVGDQPVAQYLHWPRRARAVVNAGIDALELRTKADLGADGCEVFTFPDANVELESLGMPLTLDCLLQDTGFAQFSVHLQPLAPGVTHEVLDASARNRVPYGAVRVNLRNKGGIPFPVDAVPPLLIQSDARGKKGVAIPVRDVELRLPYGQYSVTSPIDDVAKALPSNASFTVGAADSVVTLDLVSELVPLKMSLRDASGVPYQFGDYHVLYTTGRVVRGMVRDDWPASVFWWPPGRATITLKSDFFASPASVVEISGPGSGCQQIDLTAQ